MISRNRLKLINFTTVKPHHVDHIWSDDQKNEKNVTDRLLLLYTGITPSVAIACKV